jgi:putative SOS response-associated peptidase YedK
MLSFPIGTEANGVIGKIHTKMPVILLLEDGDEWLNPDMSTGTITAFVKIILRIIQWKQFLCLMQ